MPEQVQTLPRTLAEYSSQLCRTRNCPHCGVPISLWEAIAMIQGDGFTRFVKVRHESGRILLLAIQHVNPQTMILLGESDGAPID